MMNMYGNPKKSSTKGNMAPTLVVLPSMAHFELEHSKCGPTLKEKFLHLYAKDPANHQNSVMDL